MQQSQEGIKKDLIKHPFRNIEIVYEEGKTTLTTQDEALLDAYINLHDFELEMKNTVNALVKEAIPIKKAIEALDEEIKKVQASFDICNSLADKLSDDVYMSEETSLQKLVATREQTEIEIMEYQKKITEVYETVKVLQEKIGQYYEEDEDGNDLYDTCSDLTMAHSKNWEKNAINVVEFDDQYNKFLDYRGIAERHRESLMNICTETITNYNHLNHQTSTLFNVWNEFIKRCNLLTIVSDLHKQAIGFTAN